MKIEEIEITKLNPAPYNPRTITKEEFAGLKKSLATFGFVDPAIVNKDMTIIGGHQRVKAALELGYTTVPCNVLDLDKKTEKKLNIVLNSQSISGKNDQIKLDELLEELKLDEDYLGLRLDTLESLDLSNQEVTEDDFEPPKEAKYKVELGDVYQLGEHRLVCGDSTKIEDVERLMNGEKADMVFTDPPYNISYEGGSKKRKMIENDHVDDFYKFLYDMYVNLLVVTKEGASVYVTHADTERVNFTKAFLDAGFYLSGVIIWVKNNSTFGRQDYKWKHEPMLYGWNSKGSHKWLGAMNEDTTWLIDRPSRSDEHPTMKPIELIARATNNSSKSEDIVLDVFGGSGSTLIACEQLNRKCYMMELDPYYCSVIIERYEKLTGKEHKRLDKNEAEGE